MYPAYGLQRVDVPAKQDAPATNERDDASLAAMLEAVRSEICADGLQVIWHAATGDPTVLFAAGFDHGDPSDRIGMSELATLLAESVAPRSASLVGEGTGASGHMAALVIPLTEGVMTVTALCLRADAAAKHASNQALQRLEPFLRPFLGLWTVAHASSALHAGLAAASDHCDVATLVLDHRGSVLFANSACQAMFKNKDGVALRGGKLCGSTLSDTLRVQAAIEHVLKAQDADHVRPIVALRRAGRRPLLATILPASTAEGFARSEVAVAYLFDPEQDLTHVVEPVCRYYGLSTSETRLTCRLVGGVSLAEAAELLNVREQTARSCLKQIFLKTETNRQAELVSLMLKSAVHVANGEKTQIL